MPHFYTLHQKDHIQLLGLLFRNNMEISARRKLEKKNTKKHCIHKTLHTHGQMSLRDVIYLMGLYTHLCEQIQKTPDRWDLLPLQMYSTNSILKNMQISITKHQSIFLKEVIDSPQLVIFKIESNLPVKQSLCSPMIRLDYHSEFFFLVWEFIHL